jgi:hypothetical protein
MTLRQRLDLLVLAGAVAISRFAFRSHFLYDLDSVNFALGMGRFDPRVHQPHPPGYFLYVCLGRLLNTVLHDANLALVILSIAASCGTVIAIYLMALDWFGPTAARFAGGLFLLSPLAWFHGTVALTYSVEAFFSAWLGYLCWRVERGGGGLVLPAAAVVLGICGGFRPSSLLFLGPLFLFSLWPVAPKRRFAAVAVLVLTVAAWFVPMIRMSGGLRAYFGALTFLWGTVPSKDTVFNSSPATSIARACTIVFIYLLGFGAASWVPLGARGTAPADLRKKLFTAVWMAPALCFFTFIFLRFVNSGYLLIVAAPACIWLGYWAAEWYRNTSWSGFSKQAVIGASAAANVLIFLFSPFYCSYASVRRFEGELVSVRATLPQLGSPKDTVIIGFDSHFLGYRHAGYYLPGYLTVEYPEVNTREGTRVFVMQGRDTSLLASLPAGSYSRFVLFPLPGGKATYRTYVLKVMARLPMRSVRTTRVGDNYFVTGPISDLPLLFPKAASNPGVYAALHSAAQPVNSRAHQPLSPGP